MTALGTAALVAAQCRRGPHDALRQFLDRRRAHSRGHARDPRPTTFADFRHLLGGRAKGPAPWRRGLSELPGRDAERLKERLRARLSAAADGSITYDARANAVRGRRPD